MVAGRRVRVGHGGYPARPKLGELESLHNLPKKSHNLYVDDLAAGLTRRL